MCVWGGVTARCRLLLEIHVNRRHQMLLLPLPDRMDTHHSQSQTHSYSLAFSSTRGESKDGGGGGAMEELLHPCAPVKPAVLDRS